MRVQRLFRQVTKTPLGKNIPKEKREPIDYSIVLDFHNIENNTPENRELIIDCTENVTSKEFEFNKDTEFYLHPKEWKVFGLKGYPGFYFIRSPFTPQQQKKWIKHGLEHYASPPNNNNLNLFYGPVHNLWEERPLDKNGERLPTYRALLDKLAWATLGYQYQWTPRLYTEEFYEEFPDDLQELVQKIAVATKFDPYVAEAATINFYSEDSIMGGHLDNAEQEMEKPIISISFGSTAVFLMGAETRDIAPVPLFIKSGDIVIMGGRSRYCYHGVAKIVEDSFNLDLIDENDSKDLKYKIKWLKEKNRRLNINTRQVFKEAKLGGKLNDK
ncbi:hypothetical protein DICPUDRAFT_55106 [Dictyostelium purpureum]|uniref:Alpha-ketoglutarate-dependent dioxygenase AlkB-like domain-containing protein n=1 Tax=Dictyostelium purpureum TaxID=5786 RepID=F0ZKE8_DICPU|nr:uncharacterized protein DICPUDRAFT_55106 [Dictyostelium purpureum]EGC35581.1 hypothetical protein DICPUDRAFT_55106 [Dictyostelium purpureum]|eukprot:XP_003287884.1 hypothetical protein DICPUDRAFT_55106 [Dictyostelium purpureum]